MWNFSTTARSCFTQMPERSYVESAEREGEEREEEEKEGEGEGEEDARRRDGRAAETLRAEVGARKERTIRGRRKRNMVTESTVGGEE